MKFYSYLIGALAALMFVSCSDKLAEAEGKLPVDENGNAWVKLAINLPSEAIATRAVGDKGDNYGEFNDGNEHEYVVENAILAIFRDPSDASHKATELEYVYDGAYLLGNGSWGLDANNNQVTNMRQYVQQITPGATADKLHAYVIVNRHDFFFFNDHNDLVFRSGRAGEPDYTFNEHTTLADLSELQLKEAGRRYDANSFLMTNMPYATKPGGRGAVAEDVTIHNLYPLDGAIYDSRAEAEKPTSKAAEINVERVLAKVTTTLKAGVNTTEYNGYKFQFLGWYIDNTNPNSYVGRHTVDINKPTAPFSYLTLHTPNNASTDVYRMVSEFPISSTQADRYRTFFAIDPNYNINAWLKRLSPFGENGILIHEGGEVVDNRLMAYDENGVNVGGRLRTSGSSYYCTENTFDVKHQSEANTTRVVVAAQFVDASGNPKDFFTITSEADKMYSEDDIVAYVKERIANRITFMEWVEDYCNGSVTNAVKFIDVKVVKPTEGANVTSGTCTVSISEEPKDFTAGDVQSTKTLEKALKAYKDAVNGEKNSDGTIKKLGHNDYLKANVNVLFYNKGVSYYSALIKHFGDYETPWNKAAHTGKPNHVTDIYDGQDEAKYLGRYGVVRNNWYNINIEGIRQIGSPVVPEIPGRYPDPSNPNDPGDPGDPTDPTDPEYPDPNVPDTPDDTVESFLKVKINIMPWVIRKQVNNL